MFCKVFNNLVRKTPLNDQDKLLVSRYLEIFKVSFLSLPPPLLFKLISHFLLFFSLRP